MEIKRSELQQLGDITIDLINQGVWTLRLLKDPVEFGAKYILFLDYHSIGGCLCGPLGQEVSEYIAYLLKEDGTAIMSLTQEDLSLPENQYAIDIIQVIND